MPRQVTLENRKSFLARYERVSRKILPRNVTITRIRQIGLRRQRQRRTQQEGSLFGSIVKLGARALTPTSLLKKGIGVGARALNFEFGKKLVDEEIEQAPELHKFGTSKIKNKGLKKALELDIANYAVQEAQKRLKTLFG